MNATQKNIPIIVKNHCLENMLIAFLVLLFSMSTVAQKRTLKNQGIFDLDSMKSDQEYYSQAVIQFQILEKLIQKYGVVKQIIPKEKTDLILKRTFAPNTTQFDIANGVPTVVLFPNTFDGQNNDNKINEELYNLGVDRCEYKLPLNLDDLDSGFQFNHYMFKSSNKAALDAFGIVKNGYESESLYIVVDYIQYKDNFCTGLPKIRYGVGIRSEIRISNWSNKTDMKESSLASLAANAEINSLKVNITIKTIGITGLGSKFNIPSNTSFDVDTYADYQKIIDFIRGFDQVRRDKEDKVIASQGADSTIVFRPQLIPVMDEYRTSITQSFKPYYANLDSFETLLKDLYKKRKKYKKYATDAATSPIDAAMLSIYDEKIKSILNEMEVVKERKEGLGNANIYNTDLDRYTALLLVLNGSSDQKVTEKVTDPSLAKTITDISTKIKSITGTKTAAFAESEGFKYLFLNDIDRAITAFKEGEAAYPNYHNLTETIAYLESVKLNGTVNWKLIYKHIAEKLSWKLDPDIITKLRSLSN